MMGSERNDWMVMFRNGGIALAVALIGSALTSKQVADARGIQTETQLQDHIKTYELFRDDIDKHLDKQDAAQKETLEMLNDIQKRLSRIEGKIEK